MAEEYTCPSCGNTQGSFSGLQKRDGKCWKCDEYVFPKDEDFSASDVMLLFQYTPGGIELCKDLEFDYIGDECIRLALGNEEASLYLKTVKCLFKKGADQLHHHHKHGPDTLMYDRPASDELEKPLELCDTGNVPPMTVMALVVTGISPICPYPGAFTSWFKLRFKSSKKLHAALRRSPEFDKFVRLLANEYLRLPKVQRYKKTKVARLRRLQSALKVNTANLLSIIAPLHGIKLIVEHLNLPAGKKRLQSIGYLTDDLLRIIGEEYYRSRVTDDWLERILSLPEHVVPPTHGNDDMGIRRVNYDSYTLQLMSAKQHALEELLRRGKCGSGEMAILMTCGCGQSCHVPGAAQQKTVWQTFRCLACGESISIPSKKWSLPIVQCICGKRYRTDLRDMCKQVSCPVCQSPISVPPSPPPDDDDDDDDDLEFGDDDLEFGDDDLGFLVDEE